MLLCSFPVPTQIVCNWTRWNWRLAGKLAQSTAPSFLGVNICMFGICICYWTCIYICICECKCIYNRALYRDLTLFSPLVVITEWRDQKISSRRIPRLFFETKIFETETETFFRDQIFSRPIPRLFFETKCFRDRYRDFFSRPNVFETDTETFLRPNFFETDTETFAKVKK